MALDKLLKVSDVKGDTAYDHILRAWIGHKVEQLPTHLASILERWQAVDKLYKQGIVTHMVSDEGVPYDKMQRFSWRGIVEWLRQNFGISARQAYDDIYNAKRFFLIAETKTDIQYNRGAAIEQGRMMQWAAFDAGRFEAAAMFFKETNKVEGLHEHAAETPDYADFEPPKFILTTDPTELGFEKIEDQEDLVRRILNEKRKDFLEDTAEDAEILPNE
jgi:hypothetical protein